MKVTHGERDWSERRSIKSHRKLVRYVTLGRAAPSLSELHLPLNSDEDIYVYSPAGHFYYWASARQVSFPCLSL